MKMNGKIYKAEVERIFEAARKMYPDITDDMLDANGSIYYMNGNDSTQFDWTVNNRLCEFLVFHKNKMGFIKVNINSDNTVDVFIYESDTALSPTCELKESLQNVKAKDFAKVMIQIADDNQIWDVQIDHLNWDINISI